MKPPYMLSLKVSYVALTVFCTNSAKETTVSKLSCLIRSLTLVFKASIKNHSDHVYFSVHYDDLMNICHPAGILI